MKIFLTTCTLLAGATAHSIFQTVWVNGVPQGRTKGVRVPTYDGQVKSLGKFSTCQTDILHSPIQDVNSNDGMVIDQILAAIFQCLFMC